MKPFGHVNATTLSEAIGLLSRVPQSRVIAGGTDLLTELKDDVLPHYPELLVNIKSVTGLNYIREVRRGLNIGALTALSDIEENDTVRAKYPALYKAVKSIATPQVRNMATLGGNLCQDIRCSYYRYPHQIGGRLICWRKGGDRCFAATGENRYHAIFNVQRCISVCPSDAAVALEALGARIKIRGPEGDRTVRIRDFYKAKGVWLKKAELVTGVLIPLTSRVVRQEFIKFTLRRPLDFAVVSVAVVLKVEDGVCHNANIVLGAVSPVPWHAVEAERVLVNKPFVKDVIEEAAEAAVMGARPLSGNLYKVELVKVLVRRALLALI